MLNRQANYGFVYVLRNECMPGIYKIGMTERSPRQRCAELSSATAIPIEFTIVCVGEVADHGAFERSLHASFIEQRISMNREFFALDLGELADLLQLIRKRARSDEGMFCEVDSAFLWGGLEVERAESALAERARESQEQMEHFLGQCADPISWPSRRRGFVD